MDIYHLDETKRTKMQLKPRSLSWSLWPRRVIPSPSGDIVRNGESSDFSIARSELEFRLQKMID